MDVLGRYYTQDLFSNLLISKLGKNNPDSIIDLGVGGGALVRAAVQRWGNASYFVADVDDISIDKIKVELPFVKSFKINTLKDDVSNRLSIEKNSIDIAICNPPFLKVKKETSYEQLFEESNLENCKKLKLLTSDIIFLAKNLQLLKASGELGIILPDSLITGREFIHFRSALLQQHNVRGIIELPEKIFPKTEALTHILLIEKGVTNSNTVPVFLSNRTGEIVDMIDVSKDRLIQRMDFKFHSWNTKNIVKRDGLTLGNVNAEVKRGRLTHKELKESGDFFIHTTNIVHRNGCQSILSSKLMNDKYLLTKKGDILLARVGRGCTGKVCMIKQGQASISDCVYRIRVPENLRNKVWNALVSSKGQEWLKASAHGVCAKVISKNELLNFPLY